MHSTVNLAARRRLRRPMNPMNLAGASSEIFWLRSLGSGPRRPLSSVALLGSCARHVRGMRGAACRHGRRPCTMHVHGAMGLEFSSLGRTRTRTRTRTKTKD